MADIPVKPRRTGMPLWLWAILALVLAALVWFAVTYFRNDAAERDSRDTRGAADVGAAGLPGDTPLALSAAPLPAISVR